MQLTQAALDRAAQALWNELQRQRVPFVFAESCTGGLLAATMTRIPGVSELFCGSAVVYQVETKQQWLEVPGRLLRRPGPVSHEVAQAMARGVLRHTPAARFAVTTTGHLGPQAPPELDGVLYVGLGLRLPGGKRIRTASHRVELLAPQRGVGPRQLRLRRQRQAVLRALELAQAALGE